MSVSRLRHICRTCDRPLPRAAGRCPWCKTPVTQSLIRNAWLASGPRRVRVTHPFLHGGDGQ